MHLRNVASHLPGSKRVVPVGVLYALRNLVSGDGMTFAKGVVTIHKSEIPDKIIALLETSPMGYMDIKHSIPSNPSSRTVHYHLQRLQKQGKVERVYLLARMNRPIYRLKVTE